MRKLVLYRCLYSIQSHKMEWMERMRNARTQAHREMVTLIEAQCIRHCKNYRQTWTFLRRANRFHQTERFPHLNEEYHSVATDNHSRSHYKTVTKVMKFRQATKAYPVSPPLTLRSSIQHSNWQHQPISMTTFLLKVPQQLFPQKNWRQLQKPPKNGCPIDCHIQQTRPIMA